MVNSARLPERRELQRWLARDWVLAVCNAADLIVLGQVLDISRGGCFGWSLSSGILESSRRNARCSRVHLRSEMAYHAVSHPIIDL
jgi:hypothetical protein